MLNRVELNEASLVGLAVSTAFLRSEFHQHSTPRDVEDEDLWDQIAGMSKFYLNEVSADFSDVEIDRETIAMAIWGLTPRELKRELQKS